MTVGAVVRARFASTRLPGKALLRAGGKTMLAHTLERLARSTLIDRVAVATTTLDEDDAIAGECAAIGVGCFRGSVDDVLGRVYACARANGFEHVAHFGADNPLIDPAVCDEVIAVYRQGGWDYVTNNLPPTFPDGQEVEVTSFALLDTIAREAADPRHREHLLAYAWENRERFRVHNVEHRPSLNHERWTLDTPEDWDLVRAVFEALSPANPAFGMEDTIAFLDDHPELRALNAAGSGYEWRQPPR